jgi:DNA-binding NarL/FixJ family response regulator
VAEVENGQRALEQCLKAPPDVVILDISMPIMNGLQVARELKRHLPTTYIVFVSQHSSSEYKAEALRAGGDAYIHKTRLTYELGPALRMLTP